jgi:hypothetical protein
MRYVTIRVGVAAAVLAWAAVGCGSNGNKASVPQVAQSVSVAKVTLTVPGHPSAQVTDITARGLTEAQLNTIMA